MHVCLRTFQTSESIFPSPVLVSILVPKSVSAIGGGLHFSTSCYRNDINVASFFVALSFFLLSLTSFPPVIF